MQCAADKYRKCEEALLKQVEWGGVVPTIRTVGTSVDLLNVHTCRPSFRDNKLYLDLTKGPLTVSPAASLTGAIYRSK